MSRYKKVYIGKAKKKVDNYNNDYFECCIDQDKAFDHAVAGKTGKKIYFKVSRMREIDQYGNTHTIYVDVKQED